MTMSLFPLIGQDALTTIRAANLADATVLITGETGTGKSHLASSISNSSMERAGKAFGAINLATLSESLLESELFGHERGAFTGADSRRMGRLEACNGGTVFLDEVGELPARLQAKLLDFIQYKKVTPVGSNRTLELDVRIIAATNQNLEKAVEEGRFRSDLYHRLNAFRIHLPTLAERKMQIPELTDALFSKKTKAIGRSALRLSNEVRAKLLDHSWPGNIRELENVLEYAAAAATRELVTLKDLPQYVSTIKKKSVEEPILVSQQAAQSEDLVSIPWNMSFHASKEIFEKTFLEQALRACSGQINLTSRKTGLNKVSLADKIRKYSIDWKQIRLDSGLKTIERQLQ